MQAEEASVAPRSDRLVSLCTSGMAVNGRGVCRVSQEKRFVERKGSGWPG